jgi:hypothetical protein
MSDTSTAAHKAALAMEPIVRQDNYVKIYTYQKECMYRKVTALETIPPFQAIDLCNPTGAGTVALAAQTQGAKNNVTNLDLNDEEFGQWRFYTIDPAAIRIFVPAGVGKWQLKNLQIGITPDIIYRDPTLVSTEFNTWEDERPSMDAQNYSDYALTAVRIIVFGYRFQVEEVDETTLAKLKNGEIFSAPIRCAALA